MATSKSQGEQLTSRRASTLGSDGEAMLAELAQEVAAMRGKAPSRSAVFRALLRLARDFDGALLHRLVGLIEIEDRWGARGARCAQAQLLGRVRQDMCCCGIVSYTTNRLWPNSGMGTVLQHGSSLPSASVASVWLIFAI